MAWAVTAGRGLYMAFDLLLRDKSVVQAFGVLPTDNYVTPTDVPQVGALLMTL